MIEKEEWSSQGDPQRELELWHDKLREAKRMRSGYQNLAARGLPPTKSSEARSRP